MMIFRFSLRLTKLFNGMCLVKYLSLILPFFSREKYKLFIKLGYCIINNNVSTKNNYKLFMDYYLVFFYFKRTIYKQVELDLIYKDNDFFIINKNSGIVMYPSCKNFNNTISLSLLNINNDLITLPRFGIVHRLDKYTTGIFVVANNFLSFRCFLKQFKNRVFKKNYEAIVFGKLFNGIKIDTHLSKIRKKKIKMVAGNIGKRSITNMYVINSFDRFSHIGLDLITGRTHQIRAHMEYINNCIIGDKIYYDNNSKNCDFNRQALHSKKSVFMHPKYKIEIICNIKLPFDIRSFIDKLKFI